jgi:cell division transport system ATP-binding protein
MAATERDPRTRMERERDAARRRTAAERASGSRSGTRTSAEKRARTSEFGALRPASPDSVVEFRHVSKQYVSGDVGLERATFSVRRGEFVFLVGATGSGKSTVMRLLIKEFEPSEGTIFVAGRSLTDMSRKKVPFYRRNLGVVFQDFKLLPNRTVYDNVAYALQVTGAGRRRIRATVPDILRLTGLSTKLHSFPHQLSGGEQQRVAVARAFANHPPLLLADEPTGNLDPETSIGIMQLLYRINRAGTTVLVATHDSEMVNKMRRRVIELKRGRIVRDEAGGLYGAREETTTELGERLRGAPLSDVEQLWAQETDQA